MLKTVGDNDVDSRWADVAVLHMEEGRVVVVAWSLSGILSGAVEETMSK